MHLLYVPMVTSAICEVVITLGSLKRGELGAGGSGLNTSKSALAILLRFAGFAS